MVHTAHGESNLMSPGVGEVAIDQLAQLDLKLDQDWVGLGGNKIYFSVNNVILDGCSIVKAMREFDHPLIFWFCCTWTSDGALGEGVIMTSIW